MGIEIMCSPIGNRGKVFHLTHFLFSLTLEPLFFFSQELSVVPLQVRQLIPVNIEQIQLKEYFNTQGAKVVVILSE